MALVYYSGNALLEHIVGKTSFTMPTTWIFLSTADPGAGATGAACNEVANTTSYTRQPTTAGDWNAATMCTMTNAAAFTFAQADTAWGTVTHAGLVDTSVLGVGNVLLRGSLTASRVISMNDVPRFGAGTITLSAATN